MTGGAGNDWLNGGTGNDALTGGNGGDTYGFARGGKQKPSTTAITAAPTGCCSAPASQRINCRSRQNGSDLLVTCAAPAVPTRSASRAGI